MQVVSSKHQVPSFPSQNALGRKMGDRLRLLIAKGAVVNILQVMSFSSITSPAAIVNSKPEKEFASTWSSCFGQLLGTWDRLLSKKERPVS